MINDDFQVTNHQDPIRITASSLAFPTECDACQWYSHHCVKPPRSIMPRIFGNIDSLNKTYYDGLDTETIYPELPRGKLGHGDLFLESEVIQISGHLPFILRGKIDCLATFDGGAGFGIVDFKTANPKEQNLEHYRHQLGAYALMLERPAPRRPHLSPVIHLGLLCLTPYEMLCGRTGKLGYLVRPEYIPVERNDEELLSFISDKVLSVLEQHSQPSPSPTCEWCVYRNEVSRDV